MHRLALGIYLLLALAGSALAIASAIGNKSLEFELQSDAVAFTFIPVTLFAISAAYAQWNKPLSYWLLGQSLIVVVSLLTAAYFHMFLERAGLAALIHLISATVFVLSNLYSTLSAE